MESANSVIFDEAENRLTAQMALLVYFTHKHNKQPSEATVAEHKAKIESFLGTL